MSQTQALLIFELDDASGNDWMLGDLKAGLRARGYEVSQLAGLFQRVAHGGFRVKRLCNALWMLLVLPFVFMTRRRFDFVVVRSTPPLLHLPVACLCHLMKLPCVFWLMDAHPEMERRIWRNRPILLKIAEIFAYWERRALRYFRLIVVLDEAMEELVLQKCESLKTIIHPTWGMTVRAGSEQAKRAPVACKEGELRLAYVGNFGRGHLWKMMAKVIEQVSLGKKTRIIAIGIPDAARASFENLASIEKVEVVIHPRQPFHKVVELLKTEGANYGCVAMRRDLVGCLSPSKFSSYLEAGVPLLYFGPEKTNAWSICTKFGAGVHLSEKADNDECKEAVRKLLSDANTRDCAAKALKAREHFRSFNGDSLTEMICSSI